MERILLLLEQRENRRLLGELLAPRYDIVARGSSRGLEGAFDLAILDGPVLDRLWPVVEARKTAEEPVFLPLLLLTSRQDMGLVTHHLWRTVDDLILTPIEKLELQARVAVLLRARRLSQMQVQQSRVLTETEARYRQLIETPLFGVWQADTQGRFVFVNQRLAEMAGYAPEEVIGMSMLDRIAPEQRAWLAERLRRRRADQLPPDIVEAELVRKDGSRFTALVAPATLYDSQGQVSGFIGMLIDITEHRQMQQELARYAQDIETYAHSLAHDLQAPLRAMQGFAAALLEDCAERLEATGREYARRIATAAEQLSTLLADLCAWNRLSRVEISLQPVELAAVVDEARALLAADIEARQAQLTVETPLPRVRGHHGTLVQVVLNLLSNAIKFVAPGVRPQIRLWAEERQGRVRLCVADNGIGIVPEHHERIFGVFERLHGSETYPGTGIGLAIVRRGMERLGGRAKVESEEGRGSRFWIEALRAEG